MTTNPRSLTTDGRLLFTTRLVRLFAYGFLSVVLALYLAQVGLPFSKSARKALSILICEVTH